MTHINIEINKLVTRLIFVDIDLNLSIDIQYIGCKN